MRSVIDGERQVSPSKYYFIEFPKLIFPRWGQRVQYRYSVFIVYDVSNCLKIPFGILNVSSLFYVSLFDEFFQ